MTRAFLCKVPNTSHDMRKTATMLNPQNFDISADIVHHDSHQWSSRTTDRLVISYNSIFGIFGRSWKQSLIALLDRRCQRSVYS